MWSVKCPSRSPDPGAKTDFGDLQSPHLKEYENCDPQAESCMIKPPEEDNDELWMSISDLAAPGSNLTENANDDAH